MKDRQSGDLTHGAGERRFAGPRLANDHHPLHNLLYDTRLSPPPQRMCHVVLGFNQMLFGDLQVAFVDIILIDFEIPLFVVAIKTGQIVPRDLWMYVMNSVEVIV